MCAEDLVRDLDVRLAPAPHPLPRRWRRRRRAIRVERGPWGVRRGAQRKAMDGRRHRARLLLLVRCLRAAGLLTVFCSRGCPRRRTLHRRPGRSPPPRRQPPGRCSFSPAPPCVCSVACGGQRYGGSGRQPLRGPRQRPTSGRGVLGTYDGARPMPISVVSSISSAVRMSPPKSASRSSDDGSFGARLLASSSSRVASFSARTLSSASFLSIWGNGVPWSAWRRGERGGPIGPTVRHGPAVPPKSLPAAGPRRDRGGSAARAPRAARPTAQSRRVFCSGQANSGVGAWNAIEGHVGVSSERAGKRGRGKMESATTSNGQEKDKARAGGRGRRAPCPLDDAQIGFRYGNT